MNKRVSQWIEIVIIFAGLLGIGAMAYRNMKEVAIHDENQGELMSLVGQLAQYNVEINHRQESTGYTPVSTIQKSPSEIDFHIGELPPCSEVEIPSGEIKKLDPKECH
jgi:hypothetical protein